MQSEKAKSPHEFTEMMVLQLSDTETGWVSIAK